MGKLQIYNILLTAFSMAVMTACGDLDDPTIVPKPDKPVEEVAEYGTVEIDWQIPDSVFDNLKADQFLEVYGFSVNKTYDYGPNYNIGMAKYVTVRTGVYHASFEMVKRSRVLNMYHNLVTWYISHSEDFSVVANDTVTVRFSELQGQNWPVPEWYEP